MIEVVSISPFSPVVFSFLRLYYCVQTQNCYVFLVDYLGSLTVKQTSCPVSCLKLYLGWYYNMLLYSLYKRKFSLMGNFSSSYFQVFCVLIFNVCFLWTAYCSYSTCNLQSDSICLSGAICTQFKLIAISNICVFNSFILLYFSTFSIGFMFSISPFLTSLLAVNIFILFPSFNLTNDLFLTFHGYSNKLPFISIQQGNYICSLSHHFFYCPVF